MLFAGWPAFFDAKWSRQGLGLVLAVVLAASVLVAVNAQGATAQSDSADQSAAERCSEFHLFGAEPVDVAKSGDGQTVLAQVSWGYHDSIGCYLALDSAAVAALRAAGPPENLPQGQTDDSRRCSEHHRFGAEPVDVAKTADRQTVLARLSWGWVESIGCYLALDSAAVNTLRAAATPPEAPGAPASVDATAGDGQLTVTWTAPTDTGGAPIMDYTVAYQASATTCPTDIDNTWNPRITSSTSATIEGLANGTAYRVCVKATNRAGDSDWTGTTATPATIPGAPGSISAVAGDGRITVSWTSPADNGGAPITGYSVAYKAAAFTCPTPNTISSWAVRTTSNTSITIGGLANSHAYRLCVRATNSAGISGWNGVSSSPSDRPGQPTSVRFTGTSPDRLTVAWTAPASTGASGITGYTVQWCTASATSNVCASSWSTASAAGTGYTIAGLTGGNSYGVRVQAVNSRGTGPWSDPAFASTTPATPPGTPSGLAATIGDRQITLEWNAPSANGAPITGYTVECRLGGTAIATGNCGSSTYTRHTTVSGTSTTISGLANGTAYDIRVRASNRAGSSAWATIAATPAARPRIPTNVQATARGRNIDVSWTEPASGGSPITSYTVESCSGSCTSWRSTTVSGNPPATNTTIGGLAESTTYRVRVRANNSAGESGWSATDTATTPTRPGTPTGMTVSVAGPDQLSASWTAPTAVSGISHYNVQRCTARANNLGVWSCISGWSNAGTATDTSHTITGLNGSTGYSVRVQAANAAGVSGWSNTASAITDAPEPPDTPTGLTATPANRQVRLSWTAPASRGAPITGYTITCSGTTTAGNHVCDRTDGTNTYTTRGTSYPISGLTNGNSYDFTVSATNRAGTSPVSNTETATPATRPGLPRDVTLTESYPGGGVVNLAVTWAEPENTGGTNIAITGYTVQYRASNGNWSFAHAGGPGTLTIDITGLNVGPRYYVQIRATNAAGDSGWAQASTQPTGAPAAPDAPSLSNSNLGELEANWSAPGQGASEITDYDVRWSTSRKVTVDGNEEDRCNNSWRNAPDSGDDATNTANSYTITGLNGDTWHCVQVRAGNIHGNGPWSESTFLNTQPATAPSAINDLDSTASSGRVTLRWSAPAANGARIERYIVQCRDDQNPADVTTGSCRENVMTQHTTTSGTSINISGLKNGNRYSFRVAAINSANRSESDPGNWSGEVSDTPATRPDRPDPDDVSITEDYQNNLVSLRVTWQPPENTGGHPDGITGYTLQYRTSGGNWSFHYFGTTAESTINGLAIGRRYDVQIRTHTASGESSWTQKSVTPTGRPTAPTSVSASGGANQVSASWSPPSNTGASAITSYNIQWCTVSVGSFTDRTTDPPTERDTYSCGGWTSGGTAADTASSLPITNLPCGRRIGVRVQAVNSYGAGPWSETDRFDDTWSNPTEDCPTQ